MEDGYILPVNYRDDFNYGMGHPKQVKILKLFHVNLGNRFIGLRYFVFIILLQENGLNINIT